MFHADIAFAVELLALVGGTFLLISSYKEQIIYKNFCRFVAYFVIIFSFLGMLCTTYYTISYWDMFPTYHKMMKKNMMHDDMMDNGMKVP